MAGSFLKPENAVNGLPLNSPNQAGISDQDNGTVPESVLALPVGIDDPSTTFLFYENYPEIRLDTGMALHKPLPQVALRADSVDTLSTVDPYGGEPEGNPGDSVNLSSFGNYADIIQRCATPDYRFCLRGWGVRIGLPVPIPGLVRFSNLVFVAERERVIGPAVIGNLNGFALFYAEWELWYIISSPPEVKLTAPPNLAARVRGDQQVPDGLPAPQSSPDDNSVPT